jgi:hypothetical protein
MNDAHTTVSLHLRQKKRRVTFFQQKYYQEYQIIQNVCFLHLVASSEMQRSITFSLQSLRFFLSQHFQAIHKIRKKKFTVQNFFSNNAPII